MECNRIIEQNWHQENGDDSISDVMLRLTRCGSQLNQWNKASFGHVQKRLAEANRKLGQLQDMGQVIIHPLTGCGGRFKFGWNKTN